jgi:hypothetical protein
MNCQIQHWSTGQPQTLYNTSRVNNPQKVDRLKGKEEKNQKNEKHNK